MAKMVPRRLAEQWSRCLRSRQTEGGADRGGGREFGVDLVKWDTPAGHPSRKVKSSRWSDESGALVNPYLKDMEW